MLEAGMEFRNWMAATWLGWALGIVLTVAAAFGFEGLGAGGMQTPVGVGMGAGVGLMQSRRLKGIVPQPRLWISASVAGLGIPFAVWDALKWVGFESAYSLYAVVAVGGVLAGCGQAFLLRGAGVSGWGWVAASGVGWSLAGASGAAADWMPRALGVRGLGGAGIFLCLALLGGALLGLVTGYVLAEGAARCRSGSAAALY
jgi:hypothetical protein